MSTRDVPAHERLAYWTEAVCDAYVQLDCRAPVQRRQVDGEIRIDTLSTLELSRVTASAQQVRRTPSTIARSGEDYFLVRVQTAGTGLVTQDDRAALLQPGDFALYDSTRPYELTFTGPFRQYVLMLPGATLRSRLRETRGLTARKVGGSRGAGHLMINMIETLATDIDVLEPGAAAAVASSVEHIVVAGLSALTGEDAPADGEDGGQRLVEARREQIKAYARSRLRDPALSVAAVAAALHLSVSTVHRSFAGEPLSVAEWIWAQRLDAIRDELCDPATRHRTVSDVAFSWGFVDASHFSRAFRNRFGCAPSQVRFTAEGNTTESAPQAG
jgi:AraC-like DNA-binding protein